MLHARDGSSVELDVTLLSDRRLRVETGTGLCDLDLLAHDDGMLRLRIDGHIGTARAIRHGQTVAVSAAGAAHEFTLPDPLAASDQTEAGGDRLTAPMPGLIRVISTEPGQDVSKGDTLIVMEAMKMEHALLAPRDGTIAEIFVTQGDQVADGTTLLVLESEDGAA